jgi:hypothetical protein
MVINQHPDNPWKKWAQSVEIPQGAKIALFTTYKLATGSMFQRMRRYLNGNGSKAKLGIKSRDGRLNDAQAQQISRFVDG